MTSVFRRSFTRDLRTIKNRRVLTNVGHAIENAEAAKTVADIANLKKLSHTKNCYRIRVGEYRIGIVIEADSVEFVRCLHR